MIQESKKTDRLERHILDTYHYLRLGMAATALTFPLLLWLGGVLLIDTPIQESMSAYYHTGMRNVFVGILFAIGFFLLLYKGFSKQEDWALNLAGALAVGIAVFPMNIEWTLGCSTQCQAISFQCSDCLTEDYRPFTAGRLHGTCAILFFLSIAYICLFRSSDTIEYVRNVPLRAWYKRLYVLLGIAMVALPASAATLIWLASSAHNGEKDLTVFFVEFAAVWVFAIYWIAKTIEIRTSNTDREYAGPKSKD